jgi:hypothetical protein
MMCMVTVDLVCRPLTSWGRWGRCRGEGEEGSNHLCGRGGAGQRASRGLGGVHRVDVLIRAVFFSFD